MTTAHGSGRSGGTSRPPRPEPAARKSTWIPRIEAWVWQRLAPLRSWASILVYVGLAARANRLTGKCFASQTDIQREAGCGRRVVSEAYAALERLGLIRRTRRGRSGRANEFIVFGLREAKYATGPASASRPAEEVLRRPEHGRGIGMHHDGAVECTINAQSSAPQHTPVQSPISDTTTTSAERCSASARRSSSSSLSTCLSLGHFPQPLQALARAIIFDDWRESDPARVISRTYSIRDSPDDFTAGVGTLLDHLTDECGGHDAVGGDSLPEAARRLHRAILEMGGVIPMEPGFADVLGDLRVKLRWVCHICGAIAESPRRTSYSTGRELSDT